jgi:ABC-type glycerol-3-phosphate transport system substrate-binding protein
MKKISALLAVLALTLVIGACGTKDKINKATTFNIDYTNEVAVPSASIGLTGTQDFSSPDIPTGSSARFATEGTAPNLIDDIKVTRFNLSNPNGTLDYLKSITISMQATGLPDAVIATKTAIPAGLSSIACDLSGANIKEYISKDIIKLKATLTFSTTQKADQKLKTDLTVTVNGKKL